MYTNLFIVDNSSEPGNRLPKKPYQWCNTGPIHTNPIYIHMCNNIRGNIIRMFYHTYLIITLSVNIVLNCKPQINTL